MNTEMSYDFSITLCNQHIHLQNNNENSENQKR